MVLLGCRITRNFNWRKNMRETLKNKFLKVHCFLSSFSPLTCFRLAALAHHATKPAFAVGLLPCHHLLQSVQTPCCSTCAAQTVSLASNQRVNHNETMRRKHVIGWRKILLFSGVFHLQKSVQVKDADGRIVPWSLYAAFYAVIYRFCCYGKYEHSPWQLHRAWHTVHST